MRPPTTEPVTVPERQPNSDRVVWPCELLADPQALMTTAATIGPRNLTLTMGFHPEFRRAVFITEWFRERNEVAGALFAMDRYSKLDA